MDGCVGLGLGGKGGRRVGGEVHPQAEGAELGLPTVRLAGVDEVVEIWVRYSGAGSIGSGRGVLRDRDGGQQSMHGVAQRSELFLSKSRRGMVFYA